MHKDKKGLGVGVYMLEGGTPHKFKGGTKTMRKEYTGNSFKATFTDENGYFSLTGDIGGGGGAIGDELVKIDPRFKMLNDMHLSNADTGEPMHALENGYYHFNKMPVFHSLEDYWNIDRLTDDQRDRIKSAMQEKAGVYFPIRCKEMINGVPLFEDTKQAVSAVMEEIRPTWERQVQEVRRIAESIPEDLTDIDETISLDDFSEPEKVQALAQHLKCHFSIVEESAYDNNLFEAEGSDWLVVTDDEAETLWDQSLDNYLEECVLPDLPENMRNYFDDEAWKRDARMDGRGHSLNRYDGEEHFEVVDGETHYIYRQ
jgi:hypothetical protein